MFGKKKAPAKAKRESEKPSRSTPKHAAKVAPPKASPALLAAPPALPPLPGSGSGGRIEAFIEAWRSPSNPFKGYLERVSATYTVSGLDIDQAAKWVGATEAEVYAVLQLGAEPEEILAILDRAPPPKTTWLDIIGLEPAQLREVLAAVDGMPAGRSPHLTALAAVRGITGPSEEERVANLPSKAIWHMAKKAAQYNVLTPKARGALGDFAKKRGYQENNTGKPFSGPQLGFLTDLLSQLADAGAVKRKSPDGDQAFCDAVLDALGR